MDPQTILRSDFLDILFENRNKEYGAYLLRKEYDHRMHISLALMGIFIAGSCLILAGHKNNIAPILINKIPVDYAPKKKNDDLKTKKVEVKKHSSHLTNAITYPPKIVNYKIDQPMPKPTDPDTDPISSSQGSVSGTEVLGTENGKDTAQRIQQIVTAAPDNEEPIEHPDIMPEFPGGTKALSKFLSDNLVSPEELQENEFHDVKIRFVVDETGILTDMKVSLSGGRAFDQEVIRVLQKMPRWHPGKFHEKNVNVYFTLPVKFASSDN